MGLVYVFFHRKGNFSRNRNELRINSLDKQPLTGPWDNCSGVDQMSSNGQLRKIPGECMACFCCMFLLSKHHLKLGSRSEKYINCWYYQTTVKGIQEKNSLYRSWYYLKFRASTAGTRIYALWIREDPCLHEKKKKKLSHNSWCS